MSSIAKDAVKLVTLFESCNNFYDSEKNVSKSYLMNDLLDKSNCDIDCQKSILPN